MSIRLIRVSKELNVGVSSLVEFLHKKGVEIEANPNVRIEDEHHDMLLLEFGKDKNIKKSVDRQREEQLNKEKKETVAIEGYDVPDKEQKDSEEKTSTTPTTLTEDIKPHFKIVGNIDLDKLNAKPKKVEEPEETKEAPVKASEKAKELGYVETIMQRRRYLPDIHSNNAIVRGFAERNAINAPIQGSAADIIKMAMIDVDKAMTEQGVKSKLLLQVHDELVFDVHVDEQEIMHKLVKTSMENAVKLVVPMQVEIKLAKNWLDAH